MNELKFNEGDYVYKTKGYDFEGPVVAAFYTTEGNDRYVVELEHNGMLHIFGPNQLELAE